MTSSRFDSGRTLAAGLLLLGLAVSLSCSNVSPISATCSDSCYEGYEGSEGNGICKAGVTVCDPETNVVIGCEGQVLPKTEICDLQDNNCDGHVDNLNSRFGQCLDMGECRNTVAFCENGQWVCQYKSTVEINGETLCDLKDNDCDGQIDEDLFYGFCYSGEQQWLIAPYSVCHPGVELCQVGQVKCFNEGLPNGPEVCNGIDDDCNGSIDEGFIVPLDILIILDRSGSMWSRFANVIGALDIFARNYTSALATRWAVVDTTGFPFPYVDVMLDFTDAETFADFIITLIADGVGLEPQLDAMLWSCDGTLPLSWNPSAANVILLWTDEWPQSIASPLTLDRDVVAACNDFNTTIYIWSYMPGAFQPVYDGTGGAHFNILNPQDQFVVDLESLELDRCVVGGP